jgi:hypothetical protein
MTNALQASYDELPYRSFPFEQTHPDRLATLGWLFGLKPTPIERFRSCSLAVPPSGESESGCRGRRCRTPRFRRRRFFRGREYATSKADIAALGLANVRLVAIDIKDSA